MKIETITADTIETKGNENGTFRILERKNPTPIPRVVPTKPPDTVSTTASMRIFNLKKPVSRHTSKYKMSLSVCVKIKTMTIPKKKLKNGFAMPELGIGTWLIGGTTIRNPQNNDQADILAIKSALDLGITHIDTAEKYADGKAEELVGQAIKEYDRKNLFLVSKVSEAHLHYDEVISAAKGSFQRMQINYLDAYLIHSPNPKVPLQETMRAMTALVEEGLIKYIGVSNFSSKRLEEAQSYTKHPIVLNQVHYNLKVREIERKELLEYCQKNDIILEAYRPLQRGFLLQENSGILNEIAQKYNKTQAQIALNWLISQKNVTTIVKAANTDHLKDNLGAVGWEMEEKDIERLRKEFPDQEDISDVCPLD